MTKPLLILTAPLLLLGTALSVSAAPRHAAPAKHAKPVVTTSQAPGPFRDVPANHWAAQSVETLRKAGIVQGYPSGTYRTVK